MIDQSEKQRVLLTGFEPFGGSDVNPSAMLVRRLHDHLVCGARVVGVELPAVHVRAAQFLADAIDRHTPSVIISLGLASGRSDLAVERVGINALDYPIPDNDGHQPIEGRIIPDGPDAYFSTLPIKVIVAAWREEGLPGYVSNTAGTYVCNEILYTSLHLAARYHCRAGFIHVPCLPEQASKEGTAVPSMSLDLMLRGITRAIEITVAHTAGDIVLATGAVC